MHASVSRSFKMLTCIVFGLALSLTFAPSAAAQAGNAAAALNGTIRDDCTIAAWGLYRLWKERQHGK